MRKRCIAPLLAGLVILGAFAGPVAAVAGASPASTNTFSYVGAYVGPLAHGSKWNLVKNGKTVGSATANCNPAHVCAMAFTLPRGHLQGRVRLNLSRTTARGSITQGSGRYRDDKGWFELTAGQTNVTFTFHLS